MDALLYSGNLLELFFLQFWVKDIPFGVCLFVFSLISLFYKIVYHGTTESVYIGKGMSTSKILTAMANSTFLIKQRLQ